MWNGSNGIRFAEGEPTINGTVDRISSKKRVPLTLTG
jgi:hypothetical protein